MKHYLISENDYKKIKTLLIELNQCQIPDNVERLKTVHMLLDTGLHKTDCVPSDFDVLPDNEIFCDMCKNDKPHNIRHIEGSRYFTECKDCFHWFVFNHEELRV